MHGAAPGADGVKALAAIQSVVAYDGQAGLDDLAGGRFEGGIVSRRGDHRGRISSGMTLDEGAIGGGETTERMCCNFGWDDW
jgi:hypothetical protein